MTQWLKQWLDSNLRREPEPSEQQRLIQALYQARSRFSRDYERPAYLRRSRSVGGH